MKNFLSQLNDIEYNEAISNQLDTPEKLIQLLLRRIHPKNVEVIIDDDIIDINLYGCFIYGFKR